MSHTQDSSSRSNVSNEERDLLKQLDDCLSSGGSHCTVRVWMWIRLTHRGVVTHKVLREQFCDAQTALKEGLRLGVLAVTKDGVRANEWLERSLVETGEGTSVSRGGSDGRLRRRLNNLPNKRRGDTSPTPQLTRPKKRAKRKRDAPVATRLEELKGNERHRYAFGHPKSPASQKIIREAARRIGRAYAKLYEDRTGRKYWPGLISKNGKNFRAMAEWCVAQDIRFEEWIRFCRNTYSKSSPTKKFPGPAQCAGPWVMDAWLQDHADTTEHRHAGHTYRRSTTGIRETLEGAGFDVSKHDDEMIGYLESLAKDKRTTPELYTPDPDEETERIVNWIIANGGPSDGDG